MRSWKVIEVNTKFILGSFWKFMEGHVRSLMVMEVHGRSWKVMEGQGRSWKVKEGQLIHGSSFPITRLTF